VNVRHYNYRDIEKLHAAGLSIPEIASRIGSSRSTVWRALHAESEPRSTQAVRIPREKLLALWQQGLTLIEIGIACGCSASTAGDLVKRHKLPPREQLRKMPLADPTPEEIAERARECRERHYAERRQEREESVRTKIWRWQGGAA
jgi:transcriptional regulator with XRE-family HTH domain